MCTVAAVSVEKTPHGTWRVRWRDPDGRQRAKTWKRKVDAERFEAELRVDMRRGVYAPAAPAKMTVRAWADEWLDGAHNLKPGGRATYRRDLDRYILPALGDIALARLTDSDIDALLRDLGKRLAPTTVHRQYRTLKRMLNVAVKRRKILRSPLLDVEQPRVPKSEMRFLSVDEVERLYARMPDRYRAWLLVAAYGGLRWSELAGLRRSAVDVVGCRVHVVEQLIDGRRGEPKSEASRRWVSLPKSVRPALEAHLADHVEPDRDALVFTAPNGGPIDASGFRSRVWLPACHAAGLAEKDEAGKIVGAPRVHDLRHTAVAFAIEAGGHPSKIQARMGHSQIQTTLGTYRHLFPTADDDLAEDLDRLRGG